jgi:hypothetical protein
MDPLSQICGTQHMPRLWQEMCLFCHTLWDQTDP